MGAGHKKGSETPHQAAVVDVRVLPHIARAGQAVGQIHAGVDGGGKAVLFAPLAQCPGRAAVQGAGAEYKVEALRVNAQGRQLGFALMELKFTEEQPRLQLPPGGAAGAVHPALGRRGGRHGRFGLRRRFRRWQRGVCGQRNRPFLRVCGPCGRLRGCGPCGRLGLRYRGRGEVFGRRRKPCRGRHGRCGRRGGNR